jgi:hypothetical protein
MSVGGLRVNRVLLPDGTIMWIVENDAELARNLMQFNKALKEEEPAHAE